MIETTRPLSTAYNHIRWQCRRGMKETEIFLLPFVEKEYHKLTAQQQKIFQKILDHTDTALYELLNGSTSAPDKECDEMIRMIRDSNSGIQDT